MRAWLCHLREERHITTKEMGDALGISEGYYRGIEGGVHQKNMDIILTAGIAAVFQMPIAEILQMEADYQNRDTAD